MTSSLIIPPEHPVDLRLAPSTIRRSVLMAETPVGTGAHQIDIGTVRYVIWRAATDLEMDGDFIRSIDHVMTVAGIFLKRRAVASAQNRLPIVFNQDEFALKHVNQLVLGCVPMTLARPIAGWQVHEIDAEVDKTSSISQSLANALGAWHAVRRRIRTTLSFRHAPYVDFRHEPSLTLFEW